MVGFVGDLMVAFGPVSSPVPGRNTSTPWMSEMEASEWRLLSQPASLQWKGFPLTTVTAGPWRAWLLGELCGMDSGGPECRRAVQEVLEGTRRAEALNGNFLLFAWNAEARQWHVWTNRLGTLHVYQAEQGGKAALSTLYRAAASAASQPQLDWAALTGYFKFGFFPGDRTFFKGVRILRPASHYVFGAKGQEISAGRYWEWHHEPDYTRSYNDTVAAFGELFQSVMNDLLAHGAVSQLSTLNAQLGSRIALPISGGLDSRCAVAAIRNGAGSPLVNGLSSVLCPPSSDRLWTYSYGYEPGSIETTIASQVAACHKLDFQAFVIGPYLFDRLEHILACAEGFHDITQCRQAAVTGEIREHADYLLGGHLGDLLMDEIGLAGRTVTPEEIRQHAVYKMEKRGGGWLVENLCRSGMPGADTERMAEGLLQQELEQLDRIGDPDFRVKCLKMDQWVFRWTNSSLRMFQSAAFPRLPFYDNRLIDLFCTIPTDMVAKRRLQIDYLKRFAPDLARIKWQARDADLFSAGRSPLWSLPKRALRRAGRAISGKQVLQRNWEVQFGGKAGRANLEHWLTRPGLKLHDFVEPAKTQSLITEFYARWPDPALGYSVSMLLTFSAWLEQSGT